MSSAGACDPCLRRTWLIARLASRVEIARHQRRRLREILALADETLLDALADDAGPAIRAAYAAFNPDELRAQADAAEVAAICRHDAHYPVRLLHLQDAPAVLFTARSAAQLQRLVGGGLDDGPLAVAVVGMRQPSPEGLEVARALGRGLAAAGVTVVSGMALGIDSAAHAGALDAGGPTVAVLAGGADVPYPRRMSTLHRALVVSRAVVSEMPPGFTPFRWCFPARNRIIAGLAHMTIVVEAAERSGSLITAEIAADLGRDVGAVPGLVTGSRWRGSNALLRDGATLIRDAQDALDAVIGVEEHARPRSTRGLPTHLHAVLEAVDSGCDTLAAIAPSPAGVRSALAALTELELRGCLRRVTGGRYVVVPT